MKKKAKGRGLNVLFLIVFLAGFAIMLYPSVSNMWNTRRQQDLITQYEETVSDLASDDTVDYEYERMRAVIYNEGLYPTPEIEAFQLDSDAIPDAEYMDCLNLAGDGIMGYVYIPRIDIRLPIYHTTSDEVLKKGAGHLEGSSLPVGGINTHTVIAAHRGLPNASMFTDLDKMEEGDHFLIYVLDEVLCYEVDNIEVVDPDDTSDLYIVEGEDLATLLTCTPYGVNTERLFVRGHRVDYVEDEITDEAENITGSIYTAYSFWLALGFGAAAVAILLMMAANRRHGKNRPHS